jgi:hypothetical protein
VCVILCIVVPLPPGTKAIAVNNSNSNDDDDDDDDDDDNNNKQYILRTVRYFIVHIDAPKHTHSFPFTIAQDVKVCRVCVLWNDCL